MSINDANDFIIQEWNMKFDELENGCDETAHTIVSCLTPWWRELTVAISPLGFPRTTSL
jgi:hypothetical protein